MEDGPAGRGLDEADQVAPLETMLHGRQWSLPIHAPDLAQEWLEPDPVFADGPQLDARVWESCCDRTQQWAQALLES